MYELAAWDDLPDRFADPRCDDFMVACSGGWTGGISIGAAMMHKPTHQPQCFGAGEDAICTTVLLRRL